MMDMYGQSNAMGQNQQTLNSYFENMKNQFTPGYKSESVQFNDIMSSTGTHGAKKKTTNIIFTQGEIFKTQKPTNLAINGQGFFMLNDGNKTHYTRDGRFEFKEGQLKSDDGKTVMGYALDSQGNMTGTETTPISMSMDPKTKLYGGKYTGYHFDETGKLYGESTNTDPVTGQTVTGSTPLYQAAVASFANASSLKKTGTTTFEESQDSGHAVVGVAGQGALGAMCPGSLELANVDFMQQGAAIGIAKQAFDANMAAFRAMDKLTQSALGLVK
jgi:flagellar hook protein FlgE